MDQAPPGQIVINTSIVDSAGHGIDRGWVGAEIDKAPTNTFQGVAHCVQTLPRPSAAVCPATPACKPGE